MAKKVPEYEIEKSYSVYNNKEGTCIKVGPDGELGCVQVRTADKRSEEWYGKLDFMLQPEAALALGEALTKAAQDAIDKAREE
jgi:hypothetical protein